MKDRRLNTFVVRKTEINEDEMYIEGYAVVFDSPATYYGETEIIDRQAFDECNMKDVVLRYNHNDTNYVLARTRNGSLELKIDDNGLFFKAHLIPTTTNKDAYLMVKEQLVDKCSFAFADYEWTYDTETRTTRIVKIRELFDVSIVDQPYYEETSVDVAERSFKENVDTRKDLADKVKALRKSTLLKELKKEELIKML